MLQRYKQNFTTLSLAELTLITENLINRGFLKSRLSEPLDAQAVFDACESRNLMQADIVMVLAKEDSFVARNAIEKLIGRPIHQLPQQMFVEPKPVSVTAIAASLKSKDVRTIHEIVPNPKRKGGTAWQRYNLYREGMTVQEYLDKGGKIQDIRWDSNPDQGYIKVRDPER